MRFARCFILFLTLLLSMSVIAQDDIPVMGTLMGSHEGYTLFTHQRSPEVYLINDQGEVVHEWRVSRPGRDAFLLENGNLVVSVARANPQYENFAARLTFADIDGRIEEYTWDGELVWATDVINDDNYRIHHGIMPMPNGNILTIAWEYISDEDAIAAGRDPELLTGDGLWPDIFLEIERETGEIVWQWRVWDHLIQDFDPDAPNYGVVADHPNKVDLNYYDAYAGDIPDWIHANTMAYNAELDQIAISAREFNEVWIVDHSLTTEEAATEAGDLLYRWGNPEAYDRGGPEDQVLHWQHDVQWIPEGYPGAGNIIAYSNIHTAEDGETRYSSIIEFTPPLQADGTYPLVDGQPYEPNSPAWTYVADDPASLFSQYISGVQRLPDGNTLIIQGSSGRLVEVNSNGDVVWDFLTPVRRSMADPLENNNQLAIFRARRYQPDFPAFEGRDLTPQYSLMQYARPAEEEESDE